MIKALNQSNALLDDFPFPVFLIRKDTPILLWANQSGEEWLGQSRRTLHGKMLSLYVSNIKFYEDAHRRCVNTQAPVTIRNYTVKRPETPDQRCHITVFPSSDGIGLYFQPANVQPSEGRRNGETMSAMGRMLAHEIKNPLAGINGAAQLLRDDVTSEESLSLISLIGSEIDRISRLADRMERLGDSDPDNVEFVNIHEVLRNARRIVEASVPDTVFFKEQYDLSLPIIRGDADTLMQALLNLIKNAAESIMDDTGQGEISLETVFRSGVKSVPKSGGEAKPLAIEIRVRDSGPGIPETIRHDIFQPFVTNKPAGQGLGLALVSKVTQAHGGIVEVQSQPGRTIFSILLPKLDEDVL